jgi:hypothetical protein
LVLCFLKLGAEKNGKEDLAGYPSRKTVPDEEEAGLLMPSVYK